MTKTVTPTFEPQVVLPGIQRITACLKVTVQAIPATYVDNAAGGQTLTIGGLSMAVNKVVINDKIALDLTGDTVTPSDLVEGVTAHDATGMQITGTRPATSGTDTSDATATASDIARDKRRMCRAKKSYRQAVRDGKKGKQKTYFTGALNMSR